MFLTVHVKPRASETKIVEWMDDSTLVVAVAEPPVDGKANRALIECLAEEFGVAKSLVTIVRGANTRLKHIEVRGCLAPEKR